MTSIPAQGAFPQEPCSGDIAGILPGNHPTPPVVPASPLRKRRTSRSATRKQSNERIMQYLQVNIFYATAPGAPTLQEIQTATLPIFVRVLRSFSSEVQ